MKPEQKEKLRKLLEESVENHLNYVEPKPIDRSYSKKLLPGKHKKKK